jgi:hypothetical protein
MDSFAKHVPSLEGNKMKSKDSSEKVDVSNHKLLEIDKDDPVLQKRKA